MSASTTNHGGLLLSGLDGSNPLGFLAALGTLRALSDAWPQRKIRMSWKIAMGAWRPTLHCTSGGDDCDEVISALSSYLPYRSITPHRMVVRHHLRAARGAKALARMEKRWTRNKLVKDEKKKKKEAIQNLINESRVRWLEATHPYHNLGKNTNLPGVEYRRHLLRISVVGNEQRLLHDQFAALGSELADDDGTMFDTALRTMSGSGHQHQVEFMANVLEQVTPESIHRSLFERWDYADPVRNLTLRIDPMDDSRYALQWGNPSTDPIRDESGSMLGGNALAVIGFSLVSTAPVRKGLATIGFTGSSSRDTFWTWPIWRVPIDVAIVRSLLAHSQLQRKRLECATLSEMGVAAVHRARRISVDKFRNFTPSRAIMS